MNDVAPVTAPSIDTLRHCSEVSLMDYTIPNTITLGEAARIIGTHRKKAKHLLLTYDAERLRIPGGHVRWCRKCVYIVRQNYIFGKGANDLTEIQ